MKRICINNGWAHVKEFVDLSGADLKQLTQNFQAATLDLSQLIPMYRLNLAIVIPGSKREIRKWSDIEILNAMVGISEHLAAVGMDGNASLLALAESMSNLISVLVESAHG